MTQEIAENQITRLATVVMDSNDAITLLDFDWKILAWNRGAERMFGYGETEALAMNYLEIVADDVREEMRLLPHRLKFGEVIDSCMSQRRRKDGQIVDVWLTMTLVRNEKGIADGIATTERDVTQFYRATSATSRLTFLTVSDVMSRNVITLSANTLLHEAARTLSQHEIGAAPIVDEHEHCVGLLRATSYIDLAGWQGDEPIPDAQTVCQVMDEDVPQIGFRDSLTSAAKLMCEFHTDHLPVVDQRGAIVGILSAFDLISAMYKVFEE